jgi:uncharacterized membrane protein required for colicin V production
MIPVEYLWLMLILVFGVIGMTRGLWKELGVTTIMLLSLFALKFGWEQILKDNLARLPGKLPPATVEALYFIIPTLFIAFIAYEGISLKFPIKEMKGLGKALLGLPGGLLNGYLIVGTVWNAVAIAKYFGLSVPMGSTGTSIAISSSLTSLHNTLVQYLPITFMNEYLMLAFGMILLLAIILK